MNRYYYDLHIHSCLSPCGDNDNTPNNIAGMATLCGLNIVALTDHNSCKNCPAFFAAAKKYGIIPIAGMELTTSEDIHIVCLFENCFSHFGACLIAQLVKNPPAMQETWVCSLGWEIPWRRESLPTLVFWPGEFHRL